MTIPVALDWRMRADAIASASDVAFSAVTDALPALAALIGVDRVLSCDARFRIMPGKDTVDAKGTVRARVVQTCGVSLEPFETVIEEPINVRFAPDDESAAASKPPAEDGEEGSAGMVDRPEPIINGMLDFGALAQEFLALAVDPYPRKPGVTFEQPDGGDGKVSPFAALERLRRPEKD